MAGSYNHAVTEQGNLRSNESFVRMIENLGDAYEMAEEMYGMIWWLAHHAKAVEMMPEEEAVEMARQKYKEGLTLAEANRAFKRKRVY